MSRVSHVDTSTLRPLGATQSQQVFRAVLDALANPGRIAVLPDDLVPGVHPVLLPALALADLEVRVATVGDPSDGPAATCRRAPDESDGVAAALARVTGCRIAHDLGHADLVVAFAEPTADELGALRRGDAFAPEQGSRLCLACDRLLGPGEPARGATTLIWVAGPGAGGGRLLGVVGVGYDVFEALAEVNRDFPAGIDTWLVDPLGRVAAIPRSCRIELVAGDV